MDPAFDDEYVNAAHLNFRSYRLGLEPLLHLHVGLPSL
ncbi:Peptidase, M23/M37 [Bacillus thuringiensis IBL 200]|nr:Peptidase, M23/M37 [Bacillus thuringiensis IBL 200]